MKSSQKDKQARKPINLELAAAAQMAYAQEHQQEKQAQQQGQPLSLSPGWGGKGR